MPDSQRAVKLKKEINEPEDLQRHKGFLLEEIQSGYLRVLSVALGFRERRGSETTSKPPAQTRNLTRGRTDGTFGSANLFHRERPYDWLGRDCAHDQNPKKKTLLIPDHIQSEPAGHDQGVTIIVYFSGSNMCGRGQEPSKSSVQHSLSTATFRTSLI